MEPSGTPRFRIYPRLTAASLVVSPKPVHSIDELREFVNWRTSTVEPYWREYKDAAALLDSRAVSQFGRGFAALETKSKERILEEILKGVLQRRTTFLGKTIDRVTRRSERRFEYFVVRDLIMFYWSAGAGWASVGYSLYPGVPGPPRAYTSAPGSAARESLT